jgi:hypothetical protein
VQAKENRYLYQVDKQVASVSGREHHAGFALGMLDSL